VETERRDRGGEMQRRRKEREDEWCGHKWDKGWGGARRHMVAGEEVEELTGQNIPGSLKPN
jgi:hypothetical protein